MGTQVIADPYPFPCHGELNAHDTAIIIIDVQTDFCSVGGYLDQKGFDYSLTRAVIQPIQTVLLAARSKGFPVFHTREGHRADLADLTSVKRWRSRHAGADIGSDGPLGRVLVRDQPGWEIVPELAPLPGEPVIDKPGNGAFYATDLDLLLRQRGIKNLVVCGLTTAVCVHSTLREASDRGYDILLLEDCCAESEPHLHQAAVEMVKIEGGVFGTVATSQAFLDAIAASD
ncbi:cysteine hydrolase [Oculatella sp. LEGE 06141]|uniref:cysteine hydrolase family protein n=1 Tax=Oculatella sp. LEGE 06141 TaxID=1828648 RepID=UPI001880B2C0|nr:isochorismatase family cysteine hydrolase [Oculatella sp. LEGE 06141]MBE9182998.1 cysteine hydrolase [Oculatella sp. LEGE 06141]